MADPVDIDSRPLAHALLPLPPGRRLCSPADSETATPVELAVSALVRTLQPCHIRMQLYEGACAG